MSNQKIKELLLHALSLLPVEDDSIDVKVRQVLADCFESDHDNLISFNEIKTVCLRKLPEARCIAKNSWLARNLKICFPTVKIVRKGTKRFWTLKRRIT